MTSVETILTSTVVATIVTALLWGLKFWLSSRMARRSFLFERLHERRADAILDLYTLLVGAEAKLKDAAHPMAERENFPSLIQQAGDSGNEFRLFLRKNRILFPSSLCKLADELWEKMKLAYYGTMDWREYQEHQVPPRTREQPGEQILTTRSILKNELPRLMAALEHEFRKMLGVLD